MGLLKRFDYRVYLLHTIVRCYCYDDDNTISIFRFGNSIGTIFWTLFGLIDENSFKIDVDGYGAVWKTGMTLFGAFNIIVVLVALNMLIAILNESYTRITVRIKRSCKTVGKKRIKNKA